MEPLDWEKKRALIRDYDELASVYDSLYREEQSLKIESALAAASLDDSDSVLDVGCGTGLLFDCVKDSANLIVGLDLSRALLEIAAERCKKVHRESPIHLIRADADYMPFPKEIFEKVFALTLLQNLPDPNKTLREMMRVAEAGSMMVVTGLKKCFSEEGLRNILNVAGLDSSTATGKQTQDIIAVCRRVHNTKDE